MKCDNCNGLMTPEHNEAYIETMGGLHFCSQHCLEIHWEKAERERRCALCNKALKPQEGIDSPFACYCSWVCLNDFVKNAKEEREIERERAEEPLEGFEVAENTRRLVVENLLHFWNDPIMRRFLIGVIKRADEMQIEIEDLERNSGFGRD